jgi:hypothetical protein
MDYDDDFDGGVYHWKKRKGSQAKGHEYLVWEKKSKSRGYAPLKRLRKGYSNSPWNLYDEENEGDVISYRFRPKNAPKRPKGYYTYPKSRYDEELHPKKTILKLRRKKQPKVILKLRRSGRIAAQPPMKLRFAARVLEAARNPPAKQIEAVAAQIAADAGAAPMTQVVTRKRQANVFGTNTAKEIAAAARRLRSGRVRESHRRVTRSGLVIGKGTKKKRAQRKRKIHHLMRQLMPGIANDQQTGLFEPRFLTAPSTTPRIQKTTINLKDDSSLLKSLSYNETLGQVPAGFTPLQATNRGAEFYRNAQLERILKAEEESKKYQRERQIREQTQGFERRKQQEYLAGLRGIYGARHAADAFRPIQTINVNGVRFADGTTTVGPTVLPPDGDASGRRAAAIEDISLLFAPPESTSTSSGPSSAGPSSARLSSSGPSPSSLSDFTRAVNLSTLSDSDKTALIQYKKSFERLRGLRPDAEGSRARAIAESQADAQLVINTLPASDFKDYMIASFTTGSGYPRMNRAALQRRLQRIRSYRRSHGGDFRGTTIREYEIPIYLQGFVPGAPDQASIAQPTF